MPLVDVWCRVTLLGPDGAELGHWVLRGPGDPDLHFVDGLARSRLIAARMGGALVVHDVSSRLAELLDFVGLHDEIVDRPASADDAGGADDTRR